MAPMPRSSGILAVLLVAVALAGVLAYPAYEPQIKRFYWDLLPKRSAPAPDGVRAFRVPPAISPYERWLERSRAGLPLREGLVIEDIATVGLQPWPQMGEAVRGLYLRFADYQLTDGRILELPARGSTVAQRHLFEMGVYFLDGPGHTLFYRDGGEPLRLDWGAGSLVSVPLNVRYRHFNDADRPVRLLAVTSFPFMMNAAESEAFVFEHPFAFTERFDGDPRYFGGSARLRERRLITNFVPDARSAALEASEERGTGSAGMAWLMAGNTVIDMHVSEIPAGRYKKAHRHSDDAFILILSGEGYSLVWQGDDFANRQRIEWKKGTLFVPPTYWYHQHLNVGTTPARYLAINPPTLVRNIGLRFMDQLEVDAPGVRAEWERAAHRGAPPDAGR